jgi:LysR family hydrogen peroxide-inducible transcriptional activator
MPIKFEPMRPTPTLRQLRYLAAVVDRCHFGQAAEDCLVSQSTLSAAIQELEDLLGATLLERTKRSVVPTALGREIANRARALLKDAEDLVDVAQAARDPMAGSLHLGVIPTVGPFLLPSAMPPLRAAYPHLKLYLKEDQTARLLEQLDHGTLDAAVIALPYRVDDLEAMDLGPDGFSVVCPPGHRLCDCRPVRPKDMAPEDLLLLEDGHCLRDHVLAACELEGARRNVAFQGTSLHTLVQMVANGLGVTLVPQMALDAGILRGLDLETIPLADGTSSRSIGLVWRRTAARKATFRAVGETLRRALGG